VRSSAFLHVHFGLRNHRCLFTALEILAFFSTALNVYRWLGGTKSGGSCAGSGSPCLTFSHNHSARQNSSSSKFPSASWSDSSHTCRRSNGTKQCNEMKSKVIHHDNNTRPQLHVIKRWFAINLIELYKCLKRSAYCSDREQGIHFEFQRHQHGACSVA